MGMIGEIFAKAGLQVDNSGFAAYSAKLKAAEGEISDFSSVSQGLMAGAFTVPAVAVAGAAAYGVKLASGFQDAQVSLTNLYGSSDIAKEKFNWIKDFAAETPFNFDEVEEGAIKMKSYGMDIEQYGRTMGDTAANMGKSYNDIVEAYADAGQGEFERLKEFGVKAVQVQKSNLDKYAEYGAQVGDTVLTYTNKSGQQMAEVVDRNNSQMVYSTLNNIFDVEKGFKGAMETRSKTLSGMMSTITDNLGFGFAKLVGSDLENSTVKTYSLMGALMALAGVAGDLSSAFANMSGTTQTVITVIAGSVAVIGLLAAGVIAAQAATALLGGSIAAALVPPLMTAVGLFATVVLPIAAVAAGLVLLNEKTGLVSAAWQTAKDLFTIFVDAVEGAASDLSSWVVSEFDKIKQAAEDIIPQSVIDKVEGFAGWVSEKVGGWSGGIHEEAEGIRKKGQSTSPEQKTTVAADTSQAVKNVTTLDGMVKLLGSDSKKTTSDMSSMGSVSMSGTSGQVTGLDNTVKKTQGSSKQLRIYLDDAGHVTMNGTNSQLSMIDSKGKSTKVTISQALGILTAAGNTNMSGTVNQLGLVDSKGKIVKLTTEQATNLLKQAGSQSMSGTVSGINDIVSAWNKARTAANEYAKMAISNREAEKIIEGSTSTGQTKNGVTVVGAGQSIQSHNVKTDIHVNTINYNNPTASNRGTLKIISRS